MPDDDSERIRNSCTQPNSLPDCLGESKTHDDADALVANRVARVLFAGCTPDIPLAGPAEGQ
jgi:hypothetical protein